MKAAYYTTFVRKACSPEEAVVTLAHILNDFDRSYNLAEDPPGAGGDSPAMSETSTEVTSFTWMSDKARNRYYLRTISQLNSVNFDLDRLSGIGKGIAVPFDQMNDAMLDGTALMLRAAG